MDLIIDATTTQDQLSHHGIGQYTKNLLTAMSDQGLNKFDKVTLLLFNAKSTLDRCIEKNPNKFEIKRIGKLRPDNYLNFYWFKKQYLPAIKQIINDNPKEKHLYFAPYFKRGLPVSILPTIVTIHDFAQPYFNSYSARKGLINYIRKLQFWNSMSKTQYADDIITDSEHTKKDYLKYYPNFNPKKIHTVYLGVEPDNNEDLKEKEKVDKYLPKDWKDKGYMIYMGGTPSPNKNSDSVLKSYRKFLNKLNEKEKAPYLIIAGSSFTKERSKQVDKFHELVTKLQLDDQVIYTGFYAEEDKFALLKNASLFIHLSLYEGFGLAVADAMRAKLPIIAHKGTSYLEVLGDSGMLVDSLNHKKVGDTIYKLWKGKEKRNLLAHQAYKKSLEFTWEKTALETLKVFNSTANKI